MYFIIYLPKHTCFRTGIYQTSQTRKRGLGGSFRNLYLAALDLLQSSRELAPLLHDNDRTCVPQHLLHLGLLVVGVGSHVADDLDAGARAAEGARLGVLDGNRLLGGLAEGLEGMQTSLPKYLSWPTFSMEALTRRRAEDETTARWYLPDAASFSSSASTPAQGLRASLSLAMTTSSSFTTYFSRSSGPISKLFCFCRVVSMPRKFWPTNSVMRVSPVKGFSILTLRSLQIWLMRSAQPSKASSSERTRVLSQSNRMVVIFWPGILADVGAVVCRCFDVFERGGMDRRTGIAV
ncbi:hypothetical protein FJTKL_03388 [Diaporthe vaccinii]|uniref:Uncharacterized protein n=1 Tax=Diaporthe vaccinii TaxID=105482 RepID=A0ABR4F2B7_9PEZI